MSDKSPSKDTGAPESENSEKSATAKKTTKKEAPLADLSALSFAPAWAKEGPKKQNTAGASRKKDSGGGEKRTQGRRQDDRRGGRDYQKGGQGDRRRKPQGGRDPRREKRDHRRTPAVTVPEGIKARIMPIEEGLDALAKQISDTGRTHSVFDLAWLVLGGLERFHVIFESEEQPLYRSLTDHSLWISQKECLTHLWSSGTVNQFYEEEVVEVDPPKGNFQSVARCGLSKELIGPPNHHAYQQNLLDLYLSLIHI